jgi:hypothetical protein
VCDRAPGAESEKILVTNISGSTATVTRGADGTTPVAHSSGFTVQAVLTRASLLALQPGIIIHPSSVTSGATDAAAIQAAVTALGSSPGVIKLAPTAPWYVSCGTVVVTHSGQYIDATGCIINAVGAGDLFRFYDTNYFASTGVGGGILGFPLIDGTSTTGNACAFHAGDILQLAAFLIVQNFTAGTTSKGVWFDNEYYWTEQLYGRVRVQNCTTHVVFDNPSSGSSTSTGSFERTDLDLYVNQINPAFDGVVFQNGAFILNGSIRYRGNFASSATSLTSTVLRLTGSTPSGHAQTSASNISSSFIDIGVECNGGNTYTPQTIVFGSGANYLNGMGLLNFGAAAPFTASNNSGDIQGIFVISGDDTLLSGLAFPTNVGFAGGLNLGNYVSATSITANGQTITTDGVPALIPVTSSAAYNGLILAGGFYDGQVALLQNTGSYPLTFAAPGTSNVADGTSDVVQPGQMALYAWGYFAGLWYRIGAPGQQVIQPSGDATGAKDTAAINTALTAAGPVSLGPGLFYVNQPLSLPSNTALKGAGKGITTIRMASGSWSGVAQVNSINGVGAMQTAGNTTASKISVRDLTIDGNLTGVTALPSWIAGTQTCSPLHLNDVTGLTIENVEVINPVGYTIYLQGCSQFTVTGCTVVSGQTNAAQSWGSPTQQDGIHLDSCTLGVVDGNYIDTGTYTTNVGDDGIALQSYSAIHDIIISNNVIRSAEGGIDLALSGANIYNITITGNSIEAAQNGGVISHPFIVSSAISYNITITGNIIANAISAANSNKGAISLLDYGDIGTAAQGWADITVSGNTITGTSYGYGIYARYGDTLEISGNTLYNNAVARAIQIGDSLAGTQPVTNFQVTGNTINAAGSTGTPPTGIMVIDSHDGVISENTIPGPAGPVSGGIGIRLLTEVTATTGIAVTGNRVYTWETGIQEDGGGDYNSYTGNLLTGCTTSRSLSGTHNLIPDIEQFTALTTPYTLASGTALQKLFNATTAGALTVAASTTYFFECQFDLSSVASASGTVSFGFGGTATLTSIKYTAVTQKSASLTTPVAPQMVEGTAATAQSLWTAATTTGLTTATARIKGTVRVNAAGTLIPEVALGVSTTTAAVGTNSFFRCWPVGSNTVTSAGSWT